MTVQTEEREDLFVRTRTRLASLQALFFIRIRWFRVFPEKTLEFSRELLESATGLLGVCLRVSLSSQRGNSGFTPCKRTVCYPINKNKTPQTPHTPPKSLGCPLYIRVWARWGVGKHPTKTTPTPHLRPMNLSGSLKAPLSCTYSGGIK